MEWKLSDQKRAGRHPQKHDDGQGEYEVVTAIGGSHLLREAFKETAITPSFCPVFTIPRVSPYESPSCFHTADNERVDRLKLAFSSTFTGFPLLFAILNCLLNILSDAGFFLGLLVDIPPFTRPSNSGAFETRFLDGSR